MSPSPKTTELHPISFLGPAAASDGAVQENSAEIEVAAGLIFHEGRLLIAQRRLEDHLGGLWEFPGGKRHAQETFEECLRRELMEELGVEVEVGELLGTVRHAYPERLVMLKFFRCGLVGGEPRPLGCQAVAWIQSCELSRYAFPAADAGLIEQLQRAPGWWAVP